MEKPQWRVSENDSVLVRRLDALLVHDASRRRGEVPHATFLRAMHVIREREERVTGTRHAIELPRVVRALLRGERRRDFLEQALPLNLLAALEYLAPDEEVDRVRLVRALNPFLERQREHARVVSQPPVVRLGARKSCAVD